MGTIEALVFLSAEMEKFRRSFFVGHASQGLGLTKASCLTRVYDNKSLFFSHFSFDREVVRE